MSGIIELLPIVYLGHVDVALWLEPAVDTAALPVPVGRCLFWDVWSGTEDWS